MNILFLTGSFFPHIGGVEKSVYSVSRELCSKGYNVSIITLNRNNSPKIESFEEGFTVYRIPPSIIPKTGMIWRWLWFLVHIKLIWKADIIHFHDFDVLINWFMPYRFIFPRKKYFITFHGYEGFPLRYKNILFRRIAEQLTHGNICVGEYIKRWYRTKPDAIYYAAIDNELGDIIPKKDKKEYILFLGRLEKDMDIMHYLESLKLFYESTKIRIKFKIVGDGSLREEVIRFLSQNDIPYEFCGFQNNPEDYIKGAKIVLTSSYLSIAESLAMGKIVIAFYSNNIKRDYLKSFPHNDLLFFIMDNVKRTAKKIENVLDDPGKYEPMSQFCKEYMGSFTWDKIAEKYITLYKKHVKNEK